MEHKQILERLIAAKTLGKDQFFWDIDVLIGELKQIEKERETYDVIDPLVPMVFEDGTKSEPVRALEAILAKLSELEELGQLAEVTTFQGAVNRVVWAAGHILKQRPLMRDFDAMRPYARIEEDAFSILSKERDELRCELQKILRERDERFMEMADALKLAQKERNFWIDRADELADQRAKKWWKLW